MTRAVIERTVKRVIGPCLMCDRQTEYGKRIPRLGEAWVRSSSLATDNAL